MLDTFFFGRKKKIERLPRIALSRRNDVREIEELSQQCVAWMLNFSRSLSNILPFATWEKKIFLIVMLLFFSFFFHEFKAKIFWDKSEKEKETKMKRIKNTENQNFKNFKL